MPARSIVDTLLSQLYHVIYPPDKVSQLTSVEKLVKPTVAADYEQLIPFSVWQTWKTVHLPPRLAKVIRRFRKSNPEYTHHLFTDRDCGNFIEHHFTGTKIEEAYFRISPTFGSARADFWRYCVLYIYGGIYLDIDSTCLNPLRDFISCDDRAVLSHENNLVSTWNDQIYKLEPDTFLRNPPYQHLENPEYVLLQWLLIYEANHPILAEVIDKATWTILRYKEFPKQDRPSGHIRTIVNTGPLRYTDSIWHLLQTTPEIINTFRVDGIDFRGKASFQFPGQADKDRQVIHYTKLMDSFITESINPTD